MITDEKNNEQNQIAEIAKLRRLQALDRLNTDICKFDEIAETSDRPCELKKPSSIVQESAVSTSGIRFLVFLLIFLLFCTTGVLATVGSLIELVTKGGGRNLYAALSLGVAGSYAWIAYFVMGIYWIKNQKIGGFWPITGTVSGLVALSPIPAGVVFILPAVALAFYMVLFHTSKVELPKEIAR